MNCPKCDAELTDDAAYCHRCGNSLGGDVGETSTDDKPTSETPQQPQRRSLLDEPEPVRSEPTGASRFVEAARALQDDGGDDEEVDLWEGHYSGKAMLGTWIAAGVLSVIAIVVIAMFFTIGGMGWLTVVGVIIAAWVILYLLLLYRQYTKRYRLTNQRFIHQVGLLSRKTDRIEVIDMDDIMFRQSLLERMVNVGTIEITSCDRTDPELKLAGIEDVQRVATLIDEARRKERRRRGLHIEAV